MHVDLLVFLCFLVHLKIAFVEQKKSGETQSVAIAQKVIREKIIETITICKFLQEPIPSESEEVAEPKEDKYDR